MKKSLLTFATALLCISISSAQEEINKQLSVRPVHSSDVMYKKTITRALDLREKQNMPLYSRNHEITSLLLDAVTKGTIKAYENDSLQKQLTIDEFSSSLLTPEALAMTKADTNDLIIEYGEGWKEVYKNALSEQYKGRDLYQMEIKEYVLFDKQRSRMYYDIQSVTIFIPAEHPLNEKKIQMAVASFSYKELAETLFKDNPKAIWFNNQNDQQHKNLADAFDLRLFSSYIIKVSNGNDAYLSDLYADQEKGIMAATWAAHELMEYEHNLWEF
jgi:gliding motility associated protien GldN